MITGISGLVFLVRKWPFRDGYLFLFSWFAEPLFYSVFGARFWAKLSKRIFDFWTEAKKTEILTDNWKANYWVFIVFLVFLQNFCFSVCVCSCFCFAFAFAFFWGFEGQARWPEGPPHFALNPPYLFCFVIFWGGRGLFLFRFLRKPCSPPQNGILAHFSVSPFVLPSNSFSFPFSHSHISLALSLWYFSFSILSFFSCFLLFLVASFFLCFFVSLPCFFAFVSWKERHQNIQVRKFSSSILSVYLVSCLVFSFKSLFLYLCVFPSF